MSNIFKHGKIETRKLHPAKVWVGWLKYYKIQIKGNLSIVVRWLKQGQNEYKSRKTTKLEPLYNIKNLSIY